MMDNTRIEATEGPTGNAGSAGHENPVSGSSQDEQASAIAAEAPLQRPSENLEQASVPDKNVEASDTGAELEDTRPTLCVPTTAVPGPVLEGNTLSVMLDSIEARVVACEKYLGRREDIFSSLAVSDTSVAANGGLWPTDAGGREGLTEMNETALPADLDKWQQLLRSAIQPTMPLGSCLESLQRLTDQLVGGKASEVNRKLTELQSWVQAEDPSVSRVVLGLETKKAYLLQNEQRIRSLAELLKCVDALKEFVNPPCLTDIVVAEERLSHLEESNAVLAQKAKQLQVDMEEMCLAYNKAMQIVLHTLPQEPNAQEDKVELRDE